MLVLNETALKFKPVVKYLEKLHTFKNSILDIIYHYRML